MEEQEFIELIENVFKFKLIKNNQIGFEFKFEESVYKLKKKRLKEANLELNKLTFDQGIELFSKNQYEVSLIDNSRFASFKEEDIENIDNINKIKYGISEPSDAYLLIFLKELQKLRLSKENQIIRPIFLYRLRNKRFMLSRGNLDLFDTVKSMIPRFKTLKISTDADKQKTEFEILSLSYLFNLSYNTDVSYLPNSIIDEFTRSIRIGRIRRSKTEDIDCPKRKYESDLILYYQKGISSESIDLKYLSFYHIIENFFEKIYNEDVIKSIKNELTKPSFSYKRNKDVFALIKVVQDKLRYKNEEFQINEPEALQLVLDKFIGDFNEIKVELNNYDNTLISYFKSHEIEFSNGNRVNFDESREKILKNLRERIYKTRNSIVHSKETEKSKYLPFKHDKILQKEIFLMRIIAEKIIIGSSKEI